MYNINLFCLIGKFHEKNLISLLFVCVCVNVNAIHIEIITDTHRDTPMLHTQYNLVSFMKILNFILTLLLPEVS